MFQLSINELQHPVVCVEPINSANLLCLISAVCEGHVGKQSSVTKTTNLLHFVAVVNLVSSPSLECLWIHPFMGRWSGDCAVGNLPICETEFIRGPELGLRRTGVAVLYWNEIAVWCWPGGFVQIAYALGWAFVGVVFTRQYFVNKLLSTNRLSAVRNSSD